MNTILVPNGVAVISLGLRIQSPLISGLAIRDGVPTDAGTISAHSPVHVTFPSICVPPQLFTPQFNVQISL